MTDVPFSSYERHAADAQPAAVESSRRAYTTTLLLLLLAVLLFAWYSLMQRQQTSPPTQPTATVTSPDVSAPAPAAVGSDRATRTARAERPRTATPLPRSRAPERIAALSPAPAYPAQALRRGEGGTVVLRVNVGADGRPTDIAFADRSHSRELDRAARDAVAKWQFTPATRDGKPVAAVVEVPVDFSPQQ
jgi:protein TonB